MKSSETANLSARLVRVNNEKTKENTRSSSFHRDQSHISKTCRFPLALPCLARTLGIPRAILPVTCIVLV